MGQLYVVYVSITFPDIYIVRQQEDAIDLRESE